MSSSPLSGRVVLLSLGLAAVAWPLAWLLLALAQGLGVLLAGGSFIGVSLPLGQCPWALVNQPSVAFASSRAALWGYWLAPALGAVALATVLPILAPTGRRWGGELLVNHLALACAVLGLGWAPPLGLGDGPARGLERFFELSPLAFMGGCALAGALVAPLSVLRLSGSLWHVSQSLTRARRLAVVAVHGLGPAAAWLGLSFLLGWRTGSVPLMTTGAVLGGAVVAAWLWVPRAGITRRDAPTFGRIAAAWLLGLAVGVSALWAGAPAGRAPRALLWSKPTATNNIRVDWKVIPLRGGLVRPGQQDRGYVP
ncbi:MAG: hypothetical protein MUF10_06250 [Thermoanaerobaculaceae bacterium]|jgi:hypothetical protein|nr:hypothetical protein [Thermoanaerobaculaceae bacterium]